MNAPISMQLGENKMVLRPNGTWSLESSDLDAATFEIEKLVEEKETLSTSLVQCLDQIEELRNEVIEVNSTKTVILEMVRYRRRGYLLFRMNITHFCKLPIVNE